ncbi:hypothetical protein N9S60_00075 [bacterium]|nr:hypothetical protein [bacterium]
MKIQAGGFTRTIISEIIQHIPDDDDDAAQENLACILQKGNTGETLKQFIITIFAHLCFTLKKSYNVFYQFLPEEARKKNMKKYFVSKLTHKVEEMPLYRSRRFAALRDEMTPGISVTQIGFKKEEIDKIVGIIQNETINKLKTYLQNFKDGRIHSVTTGISMCGSGYEQTLMILNNPRLSEEFIEELRSVYNLPETYSLSIFKEYFTDILKKKPESTVEPVFRLVSKLMHQKKNIKGVIQKNFSREIFSRGKSTNDTVVHSPIPKCFDMKVMDHETHYKDITNFAAVGPFNKYIFEYYNKKYVAGISGSALYLHFLVFEILKEIYPKNKETYAKVICVAVLDYVPTWHSLEEILLTFSVEIEHDLNVDSNLFPGFKRYTLDMNPIVYFKNLLALSKTSEPQRDEAESKEGGGGFGVRKKRKTRKKNRKKKKTRKRKTRKREKFFYSGGKKEHDSWTTVTKKKGVPKKTAEENYKNPLRAETVNLRGISSDIHDQVGPTCLCQAVTSGIMAVLRNTSLETYNSLTREEVLENLINNTTLPSSLLDPGKSRGCSQDIIKTYIRSKYNLDLVKITPERYNKLDIGKKTRGEKKRARRRLYLSENNIHSFGEEALLLKNLGVSIISLLYLDDNFERYINDAQKGSILTRTMLCGDNVLCNTSYSEKKIALNRYPNILGIIPEEKGLIAKYSLPTTTLYTKWMYNEHLLESTASSQRTSSQRTNELLRKKEEYEELKSKFDEIKFNVMQSNTLENRLKFLAASEIWGGQDLFEWELHAMIVTGYAPPAVDHSRGHWVVKNTWGYHDDDANNGTIRIEDGLIQNFYIIYPYENGKTYDDWFEEQLEYKNLNNWSKRDTKR